MSFAKRRRDDEFHKAFKSVPEDEILIRDYSCARHKDLLHHHGRMYISINCLCFSAILGSNTSIKMEDIRSVAKQKTAFVIPNAIEIMDVEGRKHFFATFNHRNRTFYDIVRIWTNNVNGKCDTQTELMVELSSKPLLNHSDHKSPSHKRSSGSTSSDSDLVTIEDILKKSKVPNQHFLLGTEADMSSIPSGNRLDQKDSRVLDTRLAHQGESDVDFDQVGDSAIDGAHTPVQVPITPIMYEFGSSFSDDSSIDALTQSSESEALLQDSDSRNEQRSPNGVHKSGSHLNLHSCQLLPPSEGQQRLNSILKFCIRPAFLFNFLMIFLAVVLLLTTATLVCHLSQVNPKFQSWLPRQPWCDYICPKDIDFHNLVTLLQHTKR